MKIHSIITYLTLIGIGFACNNVINKKAKITNDEDYNAYLVSNTNLLAENAIKECEFWDAKWTQNKSQFPYLSKMATAQTQLFNATGDIRYLKEAEQLLKRVNQATDHNNPAYLRSLARNYITQHKFKESLYLLEKAESNGERLKSTQKMLFDVHLELGNVEKAGQYLSEIEKDNGFDYLIRVSKWKDHEGDLNSAIKYMERAVLKAETIKNENLMRWAYTNLADFYGHNGQISKAYNHYLKALKIEPTDAYAKKGIAWIAYSYEHNSEEALRILNSIMTQYRTPDYYLLLAEIAAFENDIDAKIYNTNLYLEEVQKTEYGDMYNQYSALLYANDAIDSNLALKLAKQEISQRPTTQSYDLLAWAHYNLGNVSKAAEIMSRYVINKTSEPTALLHLAHIYKAEGNEKEKEAIKAELLESVFELGPLVEEQIKLL